MQMYGYVYCLMVFFVGGRCTVVLAPLVVVTFATTTTRPVTASGSAAATAGCCVSRAIQLSTGTRGVWIAEAYAEQFVYVI